jgi:hypothetical protein
MAKGKGISEGPPTFPVQSAELQVDFWARLQQIRTRFLAESLAQAVGTLDVGDIDSELTGIVGNEHLVPLTMNGIRGEVFFPVPIVLRAKPQLLGYYRLLYGRSQKEFYKPPFSRFKPLEEDNRLSTDNEKLLSVLCKSLVATGSRLLRAIQPMTLNAVHELQLLTVGPQLRGSQNNTIGKGATKQIFTVIAKLVKPHLQTSTDTVLFVKNAAGRAVQIAFSPDPDITIIETMATTSLPSTSIEIKGGTDKSNIHNRLGEAEKSHLKAKDAGFTRFWTILKASVSLEVAKNESPTTTAFFGLDELLDERSSEYVRFREMLFQTVGIG